MVSQAIAPSVPGFVNSLRGLVDGTASLTANGEPVALEPGGAFTILIPQNTPEVRLLATGPAGTTAEAVVAVTDVPVPPTYPATAALHVQAADWANPAIRQQILDLAAAGRINAVELDIKDEAGTVGYASAVPLATTAGATASPSTTPARPSTSCTTRVCGSSGGSSASSTPCWRSGPGRAVGAT